MKRRPRLAKVLRDIDADGEPYFTVHLEESEFVILDVPDAARVLDQLQKWALRDKTLAKEVSKAAAKEDNR